MEVEVSGPRCSQSSRMGWQQGIIDAFVARAVDHQIRHAKRWRFGCAVETAIDVANASDAIVVGTNARCDGTPDGVADEVDRERAGGASRTARDRRENRGELLHHKPRILGALKDDPTSVGRDFVQLTGEARALRGIGAPQFRAQNPSPLLIFLPLRSI
jgi:hypothetical protein